MSPLSLVAGTIASYGGNLSFFLEYILMYGSVLDGYFHHVFAGDGLGLAILFDEDVH
jgi:hypothetical protein